MALMLSKLIGANRFEWNAEALGKVLVDNLTVSANSILNKAFENYIKVDSYEFVRVLITAVCQLDSSNTGEYTDDRVSHEKSKLLSHEELNDFAEKFLDKNSYLKNDQNKSTSKKKKKDNGKETITIEYEKRVDAKRLAGESYCDVLKRLMHHYRIYQDEKTKKLFDSLKLKNIFSSSVMDLIDQNQKLSDSLGSSINRYEAIHPIEFHENPVLETNRQLKALGEEFSETSSLVKNMNDLGLQMAVEMASSSKTTKRHNTVMIAIGLATLLFSAVMSYLTYASSNESSRINQELLISSNAKRITIAEEQQRNSKNIYNQIKNINKSLSMINKEQGSYDKNIKQLNSEISKLIEVLKSNHITSQ